MPIGKQHHRHCTTHHLLDVRVARHRSRYIALTLLVKCTNTDVLGVASREGDLILWRSAQLRPFHDKQCLRRLRNGGERSGLIILGGGIRSPDRRVIVIQRASEIQPAERPVVVSVGITVQRQSRLGRRACPNILDVPTVEVQTVFDVGVQQAGEHLAQLPAQGRIVILSGTGTEGLIVVLRVHLRRLANLV